MQVEVQDPSVLTLLVAKFLPAGLGALIMLLVEPPKTRKDWFIRITVAFCFSYLFGEVVFDWLRSLSWFSFLDATKHHHRSAVDGVVGASGFWVAGGFAKWLERFRSNPTKVIN